VTVTVPVTVTVTVPMTATVTVTVGVTVTVTVTVAAPITALHLGCGGDHRRGINKTMKGHIMSTPKYTIYIAPTDFSHRGRSGDSVYLWLEIEDFDSANFAFNTLLGATPEKGVEYTYTMYSYDFVSDTAAAFGVHGQKTTTVIKCIKMLDGVEVAWSYALR
jgi:hypothetical protein